jgi:parvulin-like peptidyl-prolyl isomerase
MFLASQGGHDQLVYSLLRVRDVGLARELWIRLEEGEASFAELAASYGEGPEAARKGVIGPIAIGNIAPPELAQLLRSLQPGEVHPPRQLGEWLVLLRLEQLNPARFDAPMREFLLNQQLEAFLQARVEQLLKGEHPEDLHYDPTP